MTDVLVVAELIDGGMRKNTLTAVTLAKQVAEGTGGKFDILSIGAGAKNASAELAKYGARKVIVAEVAGGYIATMSTPDGRYNPGPRKLSFVIHPTRKVVTIVDDGRARRIAIK